MITELEMDARMARIEKMRLHIMHGHQVNGDMFDAAFVVYATRLLTDSEIGELLDYVHKFFNGLSLDSAQGQVN